MADITGSSQWFAWDTSPVRTAWTPLGIITGGSGPRIESGERERGGAGGPTTQIKTEGLIDYPGDVTAILTPEGAALLPYWLKASPDALAFGGDLGDGVIVHDPCYPTTVEISFGVDQPLTANLSWLGMYSEDAPPEAEVELTDQWHWEDYTGSVVVAGGCYGVQSVTFKFTYGTVYSDDVCGRDAGSKREHRDVCCCGLTDISADVEMLVPPAVDFRADAMGASVGLSVEVVNNATLPTTVTIGLTNMRWTGTLSRSYVARDQLVVWSGTLTYRTLDDVTLTCSVETEIEELPPEEGV